MAMHPDSAGSSSSSALLQIDRELLWRKLLALDQRALAISASYHADSAADHQQAALCALVQQGQHGAIRAMLEQRLRYWMRSDIAPAFWRFFEAFPRLVRRAQRSPRRRRALAFYCAEQLTMAMQFVEDAFAQCVEIASILDSGVMRETPPGVQRGSSMLEELRVALRSALFEDAGQVELLLDVLVVFFSMSFEKYRGAERFEAFDARSIQQALLQLEWMHVAEPALMRVLHSQIQHALATMCADDFSTPHFAALAAWSDATLLPWIEALLQREASGSLAPPNATRSWPQMLSSQVARAFGTWRIAQLFDMIKEFPESTPALEDLRVCLAHTQQQRELIQSGIAALRKRLLHAGANTTEILELYVSTIKAFRIVDPSGVLLQALSGPVAAYLRQRTDTVRCIVASLTDEQAGGLFEELQQRHAHLIQPDDDSDDDEDLAPDQWRPDPIDADPSKTSQSRRSDDILRMLVNIYGSRELFVNEYRVMLADRLLQRATLDTDRDVQTLELLKTRFGAERLQPCEIMLRDIDDSKRVAQHIHEALSTAAPNACAPPLAMDATIVSHHFWPPLQHEEFTLHPQITSHVERFQREFALLKNPRRLEWINALGVVQLSIELDGVSREFVVSPLQATIVQHFQDQDCWSVDALAAQLEISDDALLRHCSLWLNHGVLVLESGGDNAKLRAATAFPDRTTNDRSMIVNELETAVSSQAQEEEDVRLLQVYIVGMLTNHPALGVQDIHNMLSTFARSGVLEYNKTLSGLLAILSKLVAQGKLELVGDQYQRAK